jgi:bacillithiol biosynthesis deacetylase BshB1
MSILTAPFFNYQSVLAIAAHPDDVELGCSGIVMTELAAGKQVAIVDLTRGELGTRGTEETRKQEALDASKVMGIEYRENLGLPDGFFVNDTESRLAVIRVIRKYRPDIILANAPHDRHPDHGRGYELVRDAAFLSGLRKVETELNGSKQEAWRPNYVFHFIQDRYIQPTFLYDISAVMEKKIEAIKAYKTQFNAPAEDTEPQTYISTPAFLQSVIDRAAMFGKMIGVPYAEGLWAEKAIGIKTFASLIQNNS